MQNTLLRKTYDSFIKILDQIYIYIKSPFLYFYRITWFAVNGLEASYPREINQKIKLPLTLKLLDYRYFQFTRRSNYEVLLREIANLLLNNFSSDSNKLVVDIGAWIGDNSIIWAKKLSDSKSKVIAIDPSAKNIKFIKQIASLNYLKNIYPIQAICSSNKGSLFNVKAGSINQGSFLKAGNGKRNSLQSTTIDNIIEFIPEELELGLLHLDVEGMEYEVLMGTIKSIQKWKPFIIFENHLTTDQINFDLINKLLYSLGYQIYMINEVLYGCRYDCRNFLAIPSNRIELTDKIQKCYLSAMDHKSFFPACMQRKALIEIE